MSRLVILHSKSLAGRVVTDPQVAEVDVQDHRAAQAHNAVIERGCFPDVAEPPSCPRRGSERLQGAPFGGRGRGHRQDIGGQKQQQRKRGREKSSHYRVHRLIFVGGLPKHLHDEEEDDVMQD